MITVLPKAERHLVADLPNVITLVAATPTKLLQDETYTRGDIGLRYIQNATGARLFLTFGIVDANGNPQCSNAQYHDFVEDGQLFDCSTHRLLVTGYSVAGGQVSPVIFRRPSQQLV